MGKISSKAKRIAAASFAAVLLITSVPNMDAVAAEASNATKAVITRTSDWWGKIETAREKNSLKEPDGESVDVNGGGGGELVVEKNKVVFTINGVDDTENKAGLVIYSDELKNTPVNITTVTNESGTSKYYELEVGKKYYYSLTESGINIKTGEDDFITVGEKSDTTVNLDIKATVTTPKLTFDEGNKIYINTEKTKKYTDLDGSTNIYKDIVPFDSDNWSYQIYKDSDSNPLNLSPSEGALYSFDESANKLDDNDTSSEHTYTIQYIYNGEYGASNSNIIEFKTVKQKGFTNTVETTIKSYINNNGVVYSKNNLIINISSLIGAFTGNEAALVADLENANLYVEFEISDVNRQDLKAGKYYSKIKLYNVTLKNGSDQIYGINANNKTIENMNFELKFIPQEVELNSMYIQYGSWNPIYHKSLFENIDEPISNELWKKMDGNIVFDSNYFKNLVADVETDENGKRTNKLSKTSEDAIIGFKDGVDISFENEEDNIMYYVDSTKKIKAYVVDDEDLYKDVKQSDFGIVTDNSSSKVFIYEDKYWVGKDFDAEAQLQNILKFSDTASEGYTTTYDGFTFIGYNYGSAYYSPCCNIYKVYATNTTMNTSFGEEGIKSFVGYAVMISDNEKYDADSKAIINEFKNSEDTIKDYIDEDNPENSYTINYWEFYKDTGKVQCNLKCNDVIIDSHSTENESDINVTTKMVTGDTTLNNTIAKDVFVNYSMSNKAGSGIKNADYYIWELADSDYNGDTIYYSKLKTVIDDLNNAEGTRKWVSLVENCVANEEMTDLQLNDGVYSLDINLGKKEGGKYVIITKATSNAATETGNLVSDILVVDSKSPTIDVKYVRENGDSGTLNYQSTESNPTFIQDKKVKLEFKLTDREFDIRDYQYIDKEKSYITIKSIDEQENIENETKEISIKDINTVDDIDTITCELEFDVEKRYIISAVVTDKAGNRSTTGIICFVLDNTPPECYIKNDIVDGSESTIAYKLTGDLYTVSFGLFASKKVKITAESNEDLSGCTISNYASTKSLTEEQVLALTEDEWKQGGVVTVEENQQIIAYFRLKDNANNVTYYVAGKESGVIVDTVDPFVKINILQSGNNYGMYKDKVGYSIDFSDIPSMGVYSGVKSLYYSITVDGVMKEEKTIAPPECDPLSDSTGALNVTNEYNSNSIVINALVTDNAGHTYPDSKTICIDSKTPKYSVTWDNQNPTNGKYYDKPRTATIHVKERNFDPGLVNINLSNKNASISGWSVAGGVGDKTDHICTVTFTADGDYSMSVDCTDMAGNVGENTSGTIADFTIDRTAPIIEVSYNGTAKNTSFYSNALTATVTVTEHNFDAAAVAAEITAQLNGAGIKSPTISAFTSNGDKHTATISFATDGDYTLALGCNDKAGNAATRYDKQTFTVDLSAPKVDISGVSDKTANRGNVIPVIVCDDVNLEKAGISIVFKGANTGLHTLDEIGYSIDDQGGTKTLTVNDFPYTEDMDDLYTMVVTITDQAGNVTEQEVEFSVNRFGSVYVLDDSTKEWLGGSEDEGGTKFAYINDSKDVGIIEYNVDEVTNRQIFYGLNSDTIEVKDEDNASAEDKTNSKFYKIDEGTDKGWHEYHYTIDKANFDKEGNYAVTIYTEDTADNKSSNTSNKHEAGPLNVEFAVDKTAPTIVISGADDKDKFTQDSLTLKVDAQDNIQIDKVNIDVNGQVTEYTSDQLRDMDGSIEVILSEKNEYQDVKVSAVDMAGNAYQDTDKYGNETDSKAISVLVTSNIFVYFVNSIWLFIAIGAVVVLLGALIIVVVRKRRK